LIVFNSGYKYEEVEELPISMYREAINQCINKANMIAGGKFEFLSSKDKRYELEAEHRALFPEEYN